MRAGQLNRRVVFQEASTSEDSLGEAVPTWLPYATVWAKVERSAGGAKPAGEDLAAARLEAAQPATFTIRWSTAAAAIAPTSHRILFEGAVWNILSAAETERREGLSIVAATTFQGA